MQQEQVNSILKMQEAGWSQRDIATELGVSLATVNRAIKKASAGTGAEDDTSSQEDHITDGEEPSIVLTKDQRKYIDELRQRQLLYNDTAEGWLMAVSDARLRDSGSLLWWSEVVYPESAPDGWEDRLTSTGMQWSKSPLHDKDPWDHDSPEGDGELDGKPHHFAKGEVYKAGDHKKEHWHICGKLDHPEKIWKVNRMIRQITHGTVIQEVTSLSGYVDYCTHLHEDPEKKYPYWKEGSCEFFNGFTVELNATERKKIRAQITQWIREEHVDSWGKLTRRYDTNSEYLDVIITAAGYFKLCVNHEYYSLHPEKRNETMQREQIEAMRLIAQEIQKTKEKDDE